MPGVLFFLADWATSDKISLASLTASIVLGLSSLIVAIRALNRKVASRVEFDELSTGTNGPDYEHGWTRWRSGPYIGVQRAVYFHETFKGVPKTSGNFFLIQVNSAKQIAKKIGYKMDADEANQLDGIHVVYWFDNNVKRERVILQVGIGATGTFVDALEKHLENYVPTESEIAFARNARSLAENRDRLTADDRWMIGFSNVVGHLGVNWVARENLE